MSACEKTLSEATPVTIELSSIRTDGGTQPRDKIDEKTVLEYAEVLANGGTFPPVVVFYDGATYWLADGFHRVEAHRRAGRTEISAAVRQGTKRDALLYSVGTNNDHGLRRRPKDKRRVVLTLLNDPEWGEWADREIARRCLVSDVFVGKMRRSLTANVCSEKGADSKPATKPAHTYKTKHGTTAKMKVGNIGKGKAKENKPQPDLSSPSAAAPVQETDGSEMAEPALAAEPNTTTTSPPPVPVPTATPEPRPVPVPTATPEPLLVPSSAEPAAPTTSSSPPGTSSAPAEPVTALAPPTKMTTAQWRELLHRLTNQIRPIADETGRLYKVKPADCDVRLIRELVAHVRRWVDFAEGVISLP